jgi:hypothetical protein
MNTILDKKKNNKRNEGTIRFEIVLQKPTSTSYTVVDFASSCRRYDVGLFRVFITVMRI